MVYSKFFGRVPAINNQYIIDFVNSHDIQLFYLSNKHLDYMKRGPKDRIIYDAKDYSRLTGLFNRAVDLVQGLSGMDHITEIDTSKNNLEQTINLIKNAR